ncbi:putative glutamate symport protein [Pectobacterium atrosepticum SCRI1043]|uniref:Glutamate symport protein n=1 Tax=Pectobacterium atrosepticum (strain SCRI 1043 / ATCC BAA-672) TaxID=218491 RepID=Q6D5U9_PECAS|nr:dicarboxylate/amino acid:cation symporter [Pectobacterium atrosepticum]GKV83961.1 transporter dicarboxylate/amino acid:cation Na+/H+ symporter family protein [Pectobacterium carotovorum subsp. carotovorum]AIA70779.1 C4-dicarboxylate ABC transporter [Pectobacterium atrosepticum]AIK14449.1 sodium:dicarboxylate symporter [Pectobacterium atrosepticum]ATY91202.1 dicarboxylate/amino acid:cation symporter [Pectobacterium atrosepticum]KFX17863.1 C4-dicarboxylate ABC transporter [Pectobacterium atro
MKKNRLLFFIALAIILGIIVGGVCHSLLTAKEAKEVVSYFNLVTDVFLRLIKMIIAPLVFATLVSGLASMGNSSSVGRIGLKAMVWFICSSLVSLFIGMLLANIFEPGVGMNLAIPSTPIQVDTGVSTGGFTLKSFIAHIFPRSIVEAMANNEILQILVFSMFFGSALAFVKGQNKHAVTMESMIEELAKVMFRVTDYVMRLAPLAVFSSLASSITTEGLGLLLDFGKVIGEFYLGLALLWGLMFGAGALFLGKKATWGLLKLLREPSMLAFATASSEAAYPKTMEALSEFGVPKKITSFVLPLGYSFNLVGSMIYQAFAILFIAQAYNIHLSLTQQTLILLTLMITSKGMAGVARAAVVVVAATLPMFGLPEAGILLIIGIDQFLDMGRTATNVIGNGMATAVVAKLEQNHDHSDEEVPVMATGNI